MSLPALVGRLVVAYVCGATASTEHAGNRRRYGVGTPAEAVRRLQLGGVVYFRWSDNLVDAAQVAALSRDLQVAADRPLVVAVDQETGAVARIAAGVTEFPGAMALGAAGDPRLTTGTFAALGRELRALGVTLDLAPVADVRSDPTNPVVGVRSFSGDPATAAAHVGAAVAGLQGSGVSATAKHFPGHGDTATDSHVALPVVRHTADEWSRLDAPPFRAAIAAGVDAVMTGHVAFPAIDPTGEPATLSRRLTTGLLRERLGFDGVVVTDSLRMAAVRDRHPDGEAAVRALEAGADLLLDPEEPAEVVRAVLAAVRSGRLGGDRIGASVERVRALQQRRAAGEDRRGGADPQDLAREVADRSVTLVTDEARLVPLPPGRLLVTGWGEVAVPTLAGRLADGGRATTALVTGAAPGAAAVERAVDLARQHDLVLLTTARGWTDPGQRALVSALAAVGRPLVLVAVGDPQDAALAPAGAAVLAGYSAGSVTLDAVARVLTGELASSGRLPVDVRDPGGRVRHPRGTGLRPTGRTPDPQPLV